VVAAKAKDLELAKALTLAKVLALLLRFGLRCSEQTARYQAQPNSISMYASLVQGLLAE
jgi:hypothetical protein